MMTHEGSSERNSEDLENQLSIQSTPRTFAHVDPHYYYLILETCLNLKNIIERSSITKNPLQPHEHKIEHCKIYIYSSAK